MSASSSNSSGNALSSIVSFKFFLLILMVLQNSSVVLVGRHTRTAVPEDELYSVNHLIFVVECMKLLLSFALEYKTTNGFIVESMKMHIFDHPYDALKISIPALLYLVQNTLLYVALSNLTAPIFQVTYQCKLVTTALMSVVLLNRKYKFQQWVCLVCLSVGVAIVVLGEKKDQKAAADDDDNGESNKPTQSLVLGLVCVSVACICSALAGVYFEMVVKKQTSVPQKNVDEKIGGGGGVGSVSNASSPSTGGSSGGTDNSSGGDDISKLPPPSLWMRNMQLAFFSLVIAYVQGMYEEYHKEPSATAATKPYLYGFTFYVWVLVMLQAMGGLLVAAVIKYADNVLKGLATGVSIVVATTFSILFFGTPLSFQFFVGATMILSSVYIFSNPIVFHDNTPISLYRKPGGILPS